MSLWKKRRRKAPYYGEILSSEVLWEEAYDNRGFERELRERFRGRQH